MNLVGFEHANHFVRRGFEFGRVRFFAESRSRVNIILNELVVPVFARGHQRVLVNPINEFFLRVESTPVDKLSGRNRIEHKSRRAVRIHAAQHAAHMFAPILFRAPPE